MMVNQRAHQCRSKEPHNVKFRSESWEIRVSKPLAYNAKHFFGVRWIFTLSVVWLTFDLNSKCFQALVVGHNRHGHLAENSALLEAFSLYTPTMRPWKLWILQSGPTHFWDNHPYWRNFRDSLHGFWLRGLLYQERNLNAKNRDREAS